MYFRSLITLQLFLLLKHFNKQLPNMLFLLMLCCVDQIRRKKKHPNKGGDVRPSGTVSWLVKPKRSSSPHTPHSNYLQGVQTRAICSRSYGCINAVGLLITLLLIKHRRSLRIFKNLATFIEKKTEPLAVWSLEAHRGVSK